MPTVRYDLPAAVPILATLTLLLGLLGLLELLAALLAALVAGSLPAGARAAATDLRLRRPAYVAPSSQVAEAARTDPRLATLAATAQALWLTDAWSVDTVRGVVTDYATRAQTAGQIPLVTLCGSSGRASQTASATADHRPARSGRPRR